MRKLLLLPLMLILLAMAVCAVAPITTVNTGDYGLQIEYPLLFSVKKDASHEFNFHIFNRADGLPVINDSVACNFHLYNNSYGNHIYTTNVSHYSNVFDLEILEKLV